MIPQRAVQSSEASTICPIIPLSRPLCMIFTKTLPDILVSSWNDGSGAFGGPDCEAEWQCVLGPLVDEMTIDIVEGDNLKFMGPFSSLEYHLAMVNTIEAYLLHRFLLDCIPPLPSSKIQSTEFFIKHMDDKGDHILVDSDLRITGMIDWEWAQTLCKEEAFVSPLFLLDVGAYYEGKNDLSKDEPFFIQVLEERSLSELAGFVRDGRVYQWLAFCLGGDLTDEMLPALFFGFLSSLEAVEGKEYVMPKDLTAAWGE
ncbi:hypothetical protein K435DRAFT_809181 [Dendrothele bispora CBS 962.96]|uniref:Aminoglycoside phosphotransferase domain-containing protein n=1 Tax=Dendrothele bispora (strain CBS 962.96) TaxID=1314807 RepID=A0A4S8KZA1_DENBC|nr:hypothetical protein K435DRAFT_809181 [Dendrothele bispora CBS 962.96]